ncbi:MAG: DUF4091 domain-containing protein [Ruminococcaceae bacterium]|nr:DUF4091 domain-containing protein [Oscillospiraceae bacterium]
MSLKIKQISSLEKVLPNSLLGYNEIYQKTILKGQSFSYQIVMHETSAVLYEISLDSPISDSVTLYEVQNEVMDLPTSAPGYDGDFITEIPGIMPDILMPLSISQNTVKVSYGAYCVWVEIKTDKNIAPGVYPVTVNIKNPANDTVVSTTMTIEVIDAVLPKQELLFTQWFHVDCIADVHNVEIYSKKHWELIEKYMVMARKVGINMILTPVITPPLDTAVGTTRPCTQLVKIAKDENGYSFDFTLLDKWFRLCRKCGFEYYEISHLFSQWGLACAPNIKVKENGEEYYKFGWHVDSKSDEYKEFLEAFLPALIKYLKEKKLKDKCYFHVSDEPHVDHIENYAYAHKLITSLIDGCKTFDALSNYEFYEKGLIKTPVTGTSSITPFIEHGVEDQWAYYCCSQIYKVGNRFLAMPSYRNRILGLQLYKYNIKGFLQWGYNFYYSQYSKKKINPYVTSSAEKTFPSGDSFSVYPIKDDVIPSLRAIIFKEALEDIQVCRRLEKLIGRDKVIAMIDDAAGMNVTFADYPRNSDYIPNLMEKMIKIIKDRSTK